MFVGVAVTGNGLLDESWRVFADFESCTFSHQQGDTAHLAQLQSYLGIRGVEDLFDRAAIRLESVNYFFQALTDF